MSAAPSDPPAAAPPAEPTSATGAATATLLRIGRWIDRGNLLTLGGWGLFAGSTVLAAALAAPEPVPSEPVQTADALPAPAVAEETDVAAHEQPPPASALPVRVASLPGAGPVRRWPSPPEDYEPPPIPFQSNPGESCLDPFGPCAEPPAEVNVEQSALPPQAVAESDPLDPWADALADLPPAAADDLTAMREQFGSLVPFAPLPQTPASLTPPTPTPLADEPAALLAPSESDLAGLRAIVAAGRANLAGAFTPGFRRVEPAGADGVRVVLTPGPVKETGRPLDLALIGPGWFALLPKEGGATPVLTRDGSFCVRNGLLVLASHPDRRVRGADGEPIAVPDELTRVWVDASGAVLGRSPDENGSGDVEVGRVAVVAPADVAAVEPLGGALYRPLGPVHPAPDCTAQTGCREGSNVDVPDEMARFALAHDLLERLEGARTRELTQRYKEQWGLTVTR
ncbi:hypothetical protein [Alienimonas californiensis]|uniref:Flagellar basal-body rod protein FlgF n=1 Tax=Alienimonas californiensis TaxID=2527989 RepID=A0A517PFL0_9PLAN|nr:hypothetical protein [Alienimonas californiensis]QDT18148.1 Flagellar basal-body rod protein FlgF [Alienimonas californiensis]